MAFVNACCAGGGVGCGAEAAAVYPVLEGDAWYAFEKGVLQYRCVGTIEEYAVWSLIVLLNLNVVGRLGFAIDACF